MMSDRHDWLALVMGLVFATLTTGCPQMGSDSGDGEDPLAGVDQNLQCLRWETACAGECVDRNTNTEHCGDCGNVCDGGQLCSQGICVETCPDELTRCGDACVDLQDSEEHCGECGNRCLQNGAQGYCGPGECTSWVCLSNRRDDDGDRSDGCERTCDGRSFGQSQRYDVEIDVFDVSGTLTVGGQAPQGRELGALVFESLDTDEHVHTPVFQQDEYNYQIELFPGLYRVRLVDDDLCNPRYSSCPGPVVRDVVEVTGDMNLDMNLSNEQPFPGDQVHITGEIRVNGAQLVDQLQGGYRARVTFASAFRHHRMFVEATGPATFETGLPSGTYRVSVIGINCDDHALPCQEKVIDEELTVTSDTHFDWDFETVELSGVVTANGADLPASGTGNARGSVELRPTDRATVGGTSVQLSPGGPGRYSMRVYPAEYELWVDNRRDCPGDGSEALPCKEHLITSSVDLQSDMQRDIDVDVVTLDGAITLNGREMLDSPANRNRGRINFVDDRGELQLRLGPSGAVNYGIKMYPGDYKVVATNRSGCDLSRPVIPCQTKNLDTIEVDESRTWDIDLNVVSLNGELTLDGEPFPDTEGRSRGTIRILEQESESGPSSDLGSSGPAEFSTRMFGGEDYRLVLDYQCNGDDDILPCGRATLDDSFDLKDDRRITRDIRPVVLSGSISTGGVELDSLVPQANVVLRNTDTITPIRLQNARGGQFETLVYPGEYRVEYRSASRVCGSAMPCGVEVVRERFSVRSGATLDVDLDVIELEGSVDFLGPRRATANGWLVFRHAQEEFRVSVTRGRYDPIRVFDRPYVVEYRQTSCRDFDSLPCMSYLVAGCE